MREELLRNYIYFPKRKDIPEITGNKIIVETLKAYGIKYFFGLPGATEGLYDELQKAMSDITPILVRNEKCGAYMADGYAKVSYNPAVCTGCEGPGATNLISALGESYLSSTPVVAIGAARASTEMDKNPLMQGRGVDDSLDMVKPFTKWSFRVFRVHRVAEMLRKAFRIATTGRPGPVYIQYHSDVFFDEWPVEIYAEDEFTHYPAMRVRSGEPEKINKAASLLVKAERPVIIGGLEALVSRAWNEVIELAELLAIPVATESAAKGLIPENHPLSIGVIGQAPRKTAMRMIEEADVIFFVGSKCGAFDTANFKYPCELDVDEGKTKIVHLHVDPYEIGRNYRTEIGIACDEKSGIQQLLDVLKTMVEKKPLEKLPRVKRIVDIVKEWTEAIEPSTRSDSSPIKPQRLIREVREFLDEDAVLVSGIGNVSGFLGIYYDTLMAGRNYIEAASAGYGSVGWSWPASVGVKLAIPDRQVLCFTGDGGFGYHIGELETVLREDIPIVVLIFNNGGMQAERDMMKAYWPRVDDRYVGADYVDVNYGDIAVAFGCYGRRVERPSEIRDALQEAFESGKPSVIDVPIDRKIIPPYQWLPRSFRETT
jgi:acetolactate synthase-1/2/3 large subunit